MRQCGLDVARERKRHAFTQLLTLIRAYARVGSQDRVNLAVPALVAAKKDEGKKEEEKPEETRTERERKS